MYLLTKFGGHRFHRNEHFKFYINSAWIPWKKLSSPPRSAILRDFLNQEYRFTIPKTRRQLAEKREEEEEQEEKDHWVLQCVMRFTQTQLVIQL